MHLFCCSITTALTESIFIGSLYIAEESEKASKKIFEHSVLSFRLKKCIDREKAFS